MLRSSQDTYLYVDAINPAEQLWLQYLSRACICNDAALKEQQPWEIAGSQVEVVHSGNYGYASLTIEALHQLKRFNLVFYVKMGSGFVQEQEPGFLGQRHSNNHTLPFAAAQFIEEARSKGVDAGSLHRLLHNALVVLSLRSQEVDERGTTQTDHVLNGESERHMQFLRDYSNTPGSAASTPLMQVTAL